MSQSPEEFKEVCDAMANAFLAGINEILVPAGRDWTKAEWEKVLDEVRKTIDYGQGATKH